MYEDSLTALVDSYKQNHILSDELFSWYDNNTKDTLIFIWNDTDDIIYISKQVEEYFTPHSDEFIGRGWTRFVSAEYVKQIKEHFQENESRLKITSLTFQKQFDMNHFFNGSIDKLVLGRETYYLCQLRNMTNIDDFKDFLIDTDKLIMAGQLSAGLVHEIRNPLTSLKGFIQLVHSGIEQKEEYFQVMIGEIEKLEQITNELLQMAKPNKSEKKPEHVQTLIDDVVFLIKTQIDMRHIEFDLNIDENLMTICNASQMKQVLLNLVKNGAEAMEHNGVINVEAYEKDGMAHILIIDEGEGMQCDHVNEMHSPFYTTKTNGTGLGLVITNHILAQHDGKLEAEPNEHKGTTFTIILPVFQDL